MAGLPSQRPIPGAPLLDPLTGQELPPAPADPLAPVVAPPPPRLEWPGFAEELEGPPLPAPALTEPAPFPPPHWFADPEGEAPAAHTQQDVPVVENAPPPPEPSAVTQAGQEGLPALEQARKDGHLLDPYPEEPAKPKRPLTAEEQYADYLNQSGDAQAQAIRDKTLAQQEKNDYEREYGLLAAKEANRRQNEADKAYMEVQAEAKAKRQQLDAEAMAIANQKIDPKRAWNNMSFGAQLFVGITAALTGATDRALATGKNSVVDMVNAMAARDMEAQQADLANRTNILGVRRGLLADDLAAGRDILDFQYKSLNAAYTMAQNQIKAYTLKFDNKILTAEGDAQIAQLESAKQAAFMTWKEKTEQKAYDRRQDAIKVSQDNRRIKLQEDHLQLERDKASAPPEAKPLTVREQIALKHERREEEKYRNEHLIPPGKTKTGEALYARTPDDAKFIKGKMDTVTSMNQKFDDLEKIYAKHGWKPFKEWSMWDPDAAKDEAAARLIMGTILPEFSKVNEQGVIRDPEYPRYEKMFGDPAGFLDPRINFQTMRRMNTQSVNNAMKTKVGDHAAWWEPEQKASGNDKTTDTDAEVLRFRNEQKQKAQSRQDAIQPRSSWEIVGQSPDGTKDLTAGGIVIPSGRQIVGQKTRVNSGGLNVHTYELDDGTTFDVEE